MKKQLLVIHGPNINLTGIREPGVYGSESLEQINEEIRAYCEKEGFGCEICQSNHEGQIIDWLHGATGRVDGIILNAGAYTHYSYAIHDAIAAIKIPCIEVHFSNIQARSDFRHLSVIAPVNCGLWKTQLPARSRCFQKNPCIIFAKSLAKDWNII